MDGKRKKTGAVGARAGARAGAAATKGVDAITVLTQASHPTNEQLRAAAATRMAELRADIQGAWKAADAEYRTKEQEYLTAVAAWRQATAPQERGHAAYRVGTLQRDLAALDETRQAARYPHRFIQSQTLFRTVIDADSRDMRKIPHAVFVERMATTVPTERTIQLL